MCVRPSNPLIPGLPGGQEAPPIIQIVALSAWLALPISLGAALPAQISTPLEEASAKTIEIAAPLTLADSAYETAAQLTLQAPVPLDIPSLHNVFRLSETIISGGEPDDDPGFAAIAALGVRTILSVDGKSPDAEAAALHGLSYVHVPIRYRGISDDELLRISKAFRELPGPFYVHCFHGRHRGPAAAAVGRLVTDGASRLQSLAEMRQWCGTSSKYEGLYQTIARAELPDAATTEAYECDFPEAHAHAGFRSLMVEASRAFETLTSMEKNNWAVPDDHPDLDPVNESAILTNLFSAAAELKEVRAEPKDFRQWIEQSREQSATLRELLTGIRRSGGHDWKPASDAYRALKTTCSACHTSYRND